MDELARRSDVSKTQLSRLESGEQGTKKETLLRIADGLAGDDPKERAKLRFSGSLAAGFAPDDAPEPDSLPEVTYVTDPDTVEIVKFLDGLPPEMRKDAADTMRGSVRGYVTAADLMRRRNDDATLFKRQRDEDEGDISGDSDDGS